MFSELHGFPVILNIVMCVVLLFLIIMVGNMGKRGKALKSDSMNMVINVHKFFTEEYEALKRGKQTISVSSVIERTAAATGISSRSVSRILKKQREALESGSVLRTPGKKRPNRTPQKTAIDSFSAAAIRRVIYSLYRTDFFA